MGGALALLDKRYVYRVWWGNLNVRDYLEDRIVDGSMTLIWMLKKWD
jgi:hypothetical protein